MQGKARPILICFTGIDGSGKTTLASGLMGELHKMGIQMKYVWGAHNIVFLRPLVLFMKTRSNRPKKATGRPEHYKGIRKIIQNPLLAIPYQIFVMIEYLLQILIKVRLPLITGKNVVCDRYVYDTVINLAVNLQYSQERFKTMLRCLLNLCPKPNLVIFVDLPEEIAFIRKNDIPSQGYLAIRRKFYRQISKEYEMTILDGSKDIVDLNHLVQYYVEKYINSELELHNQYNPIGPIVEAQE